MTQLITTDLYTKFTRSLFIIFNEVEFKFMEQHNAYLINTSNRLQLPWAARNPNFSKEEKLLLLTIINNSNKLFFSNGPKWYCQTNSFLTMINTIIPIIQNNLINNSDQPIEFFINQPIRKFMTTMGIEHLTSNTD